MLSFEKELSDTDITNIKQDLTNIFLTQGYISGEEKCKVLLNEYPNSTSLTLSIAGLIQLYAMMSDDVTEEIIKNRMKYAPQLFYEVTQSNDPKYTSTALFSVAGLEMMLENYNKSEDALKKLYNSFIDPMTLYPSLLEKQGKTKESEDLANSILKATISSL